MRSLTADFLDRDATAQRQLIADGEISAPELVEASIARIEATNGALNAVVVNLFDQALADAREAAGPWLGVPVLVKDLLARVANTPQTEGSRALRDYLAPDDSELVRRYRAGGLSILGKTNTPEFGATPVTEGSLFGPARNPWDLSRTTGGSSGGSAAAVAAGMVAIAHGNDGGGSLRIPASCCGTFGFKPSRGRNPLGPEYSDLHARIFCEHVITRSVRDSAAVLDLTAGALPGAAYGLVAPDRPWSEQAQRHPKPLRIAATTTPLMDVPLHPDCGAAFEATVSLLEDLGHEVHEDRPKLRSGELMEAWFTLWAAGNAWFVEAAAEKAGTAPDPRDFEPLTWRYYERARELSAMDYQGILRTLAGGAQAIAEFMESCDLWLTPTLAQLPLTIGRANDLDATVQRYQRFAPYTRLANLSGLPAMSVPLHMSPAGLPIGSHFMGRFGDEATLLSLAAQLEAARPWAHRRPAEPFQVVHG